MRLLHFKAQVPLWYSYEITTFQSSGFLMVQLWEYYISKLWFPHVTVMRLLHFKALVPSWYSYEITTFQTSGSLMVQLWDNYISKLWFPNGTVMRLLHFKALVPLWYSYGRDCTSIIYFPCIWKWYKYSQHYKYHSNVLIECCVL